MFAQSLESLDQHLAKDIGKGFTTHGPHADDMEIFLEGRSARKFASQGQTRSLVLALTMAQFYVLKENEMLKFYDRKGFLFLGLTYSKD